MKDDLQQPPKAVLVKGRKLRKEIKKGTRNSSVRWGNVDYKKGDRVMIGSPEENWCFMKVLTKVEFKTLEEVTPEEWGWENFKADKLTIKHLRNYFVAPRLSSPVTVITWGGDVHVW
jgi:hypothetical protein